VFDWIFHIAIAVLIGFLVVTFVAQRTIVHGISMEPTLQDGDQLIVEKLTTRFGELRYGDIITVYIPEQLGEGKDYIIKRVIAVEGDTVEIKDGKIYVNEKLLVEDYVNGDSTLPVNPEYAKVTVPEGQVYAVGDNRLPGASKDSRSIGPVGNERIKGRALIRFYPFDKFKVFRRFD
jgi:signal peptidase I